jgi:hypothetical protein
MKFAQFNGQHELVARYDSELHSEIPEDAAEISDELFWQTINETDGVWKIDPDTGAISKHPFPPAPPYVPQQVTRRQGRLALLEVGKLDDVEAAIEAITDPVQRRAAQIEYEADTWERDNEFLKSMWAALGGTEQGLDDLFALAASK